MPGTMDAKIAEKCVRLCTLLTKNIQLDLGDSDDSVSSIFVSAYCTKNYSRYFALGKVFEATAALPKLRSSILEVHKSDVFQIGFQFGSAVEALEASPRRGEAEVEHVLTLGKEWGGGAKRNIFAEIARRDVWNETALSFLTTLESVEFENSIMANNCPDEPYILHSQQNLGRAIRTRSKSDPLFAYGAMCESVIWGGNSLHYCWLPEQQTSDGATYHPAICLWSSKTSSALVETNRKSYQDLIREFWTGGTAVEQKLVAQASRGELVLDAELRVKRIVNTIEAMNRENTNDLLKKWNSVLVAIRSCQSCEKLNAFCDELTKRGRGLIPIKIQVEGLAAILENEQ
jgi:hypothetical protein